jgi:hypothetical protein
VWGPFNQRLPLRGRCVASADFRAHIDVPAFSSIQQFANSNERFL